MATTAIAVSIEEGAVQMEAHTTSDKAMPAAKGVNKKRRRNKAAAEKPFLNDWDLPELMPGALPSANSVERDLFERRCKKMWRQIEAEEARHLYRKQVEQDVTTVAEVCELQEMFPTVDAEIVQALYVEDHDMASCVDKILKLVGGDVPTSPPMKPLPETSDASQFPSLSAQWTTSLPPKSPVDLTPAVSVWGPRIAAQA
uniref:CUE domain-containing protein n=1 Tax=Oxyrrhis marina TaxID=2969 RepID=A0A7S4GPG0_OXYMA|mmetsp:Transcript_19740/g.50046  ORF Transcript_19740/g.50046 Transcript_19740/m.50046 type:complete len:200 (+) Transcript_19740:97-696(+)